MSFLSVPLKQTNEIDFIKPLKTYINSLLEISDDLKNDTNEAIVELNKLRGRACNQPLEKNQASLDVLTRYYDQLCVMDSKLPIRPNQNPITFKWKDAFDKGSLFFSRASLTVMDSTFERAAVLFNCGALMSKIAAVQPANTDEEIKYTAKLFQQAAGVFSKLKETHFNLNQQDLTPDLLPDTLSALSTIMLAQAQEAFYLKAKNDQMNSLALVKITAQCMEFYQDALKLISKDNVKGIFEKDWFNNVTGKSYHFSALAYFYQAKIAGEQKKFGEQIALLRMAKSSIEASNTYISNPNLTNPIKTSIQRALEQAEKDNDFIYHEKIPDSKTLPAFPKAALAKPLPVNFPLFTRFRDLFESLVPVSIQNALSIFESRKAEVINLETGRMREYTQILNACLSSLNLPAALDDVINYEKCPESIQKKSSEVKSKGGIANLIRMIDNLPSLYKKNEEILDEVCRLINDEKENDDNLRTKFKEKWTRMPSDRLTVPIMQEVAKYRGILQTASNADGIVREKFEKNKKGLEILSKTENELMQSIPALEQKESHQNSSTVQHLISLINKVQEIKVEREKLEKDLKEVKFDMSHDFLKSYSETGNVNEEKISSTKIQELFSVYKNRVEDSLKKQETLMAEIQTYHKRFCEERVDLQGEDRENQLKLLANAYDVFFTLNDNLNEGTKFYNDLTPILVRLQQKVSDFCFARKTEKEDLLKQLQQNIVSDKNIKNAPARPPPPTTLYNQQANVNPSFSPQAQQQYNQYYQQTQPPMPNVSINQSESGGYYSGPLPTYQQSQPMYSAPQNFQPNAYVPYGMGAPQTYQQMPNYQNQQQPNPPYPTMNMQQLFPNTYPSQCQYGNFPPQPQFMPPNPPR